MKQEPLPTEFVVVLPDDSMAPKAHKGDHVLLSSTETPRPGDGVLVRDKHGQLYFRRYRERRPGVWTAHPENDSYHALESDVDGLVIVAVSVGVPRQRWG